MRFGGCTEQMTNVRYIVIYLIVKDVINELNNKMAFNNPCFDGKYSL